MLRPRKITTQIYNSRISFSKFIDFVKTLKSKEEQNDERYHIRIGTRGGDTYVYDSAVEALDTDNEYNLHSLINNRVTDLEVYSLQGNSFSFNCWAFGRAEMSRNSGDGLGNSIEEVITDTLSLKTKKSRLIRFVDNNVFRLAAGVPAALIYWQIGEINALSAPLMMLALILHFFISFGSLKYEKSNKIIMGNAQDDFLIRNGDSIKLSILFMVLGTLLGYLVSN